MMNANGVDFSMMGGAPIISGTWINQRTGEQVNVRDSYMDGEHMYVCLTNGKTLTLEEFQDYVQMSEDEYDNRGNKIGRTASQPTAPAKKAPKVDASVVFDGMGEAKQSAPSSLQQQILAAENTELGLPAQTVSNASQIVSVLPSKALEMIFKIFDKCDAPKLQFLVDWPNYPKKELAMLKEYFNVTDEDIAAAIMQKFVSQEDIMETVAGWAKQQ